MFHIKDEYLNDLETNPWKRFRNRLIRLAVSPFRLMKSVLIVTGGIVWLLAMIVFISTFTLLESLPHFGDNGFEQAKQSAVISVGQHLSDNSSARKQYKWVAIDQINR